MSVLVGVDAGASRTEAAAADPALRPLGRRRGPRGAVRPGAAHESAGAIGTVVRELLLAIDRDIATATLVVGAAGAGREEEREALEEALGALLVSAREIRVTSDAEIALAHAFARDPGIVLIAGSGSIAFARDPEGSIRRVGGWGWQAGDEGSGYDLGRAGIRAATRAADGRERKTSLGERLPTALGLPDLEAMIRWAQSAGRDEVAALAREVCEEADAGDAVASKLVRATAAELVHHVRALLPHFEGWTTVPVALSGGLLTAATAVRRELESALSRDLPLVELREEPVDPAWGAVKLASEPMS